MSTKISIIRRPSGGFTINLNGIFYQVSHCSYVSSPANVQLIPPFGTFEFQPKIYPPAEWAVNEVRGFTTTAQVCNALDAIGVGADKFSKPAFPATGTITFSGQPAADDTVTLDDGVVDEGLEFEFTGVKAAGAVALIEDATPGNPDDEDTIIFDAEGENEATFEFDEGVIAEGIIDFTNGVEPTRPVSGSILIFDKNGANETSFAFLTTPAGETEHEEVTIGADPDATMAAFILKFNAAVDGWTAVAASPADNTCTIKADAAGEDGNVTIQLIAENIVATNVVNGVDPGDDVAEGNIGVAIGADEDATMVNFIAAFNANITGWKAYPTATPDHACTIVADEIGEDFNVTMTSASDLISVTAPTGGTDATEGTVAIGTTKEVTAANLALAINEAKDDGDIAIHANVDGAVIYLTNLVSGVAGNETLAKDSDKITVSGMAGGSAAINISTLLTALEALIVE